MGEAKQKSVVMVSEPKHHWLSRLPKGGVAIAVLVVVIVIVGLVYWHHHNDERNAQLAAETVCTTTDSGNLIKDAAANLLPSNIVRLQPIVQSIQKLKTYQQDPNCLYIVVTYYMNLGNGTSAASYLTKFNTAYTNKLTLNSKLTNYLSVSNMRTLVAQLQKTQKQNAANMIGIPVP